MPPQPPLALTTASSKAGFEGRSWVLFVPFFVLAEAQPYKRRGSDGWAGKPRASQQHQPTQQRGPRSSILECISSPPLAVRLHVQSISFIAVSAT